MSTVKEAELAPKVAKSGESAGSLGRRGWRRLSQVKRGEGDNAVDKTSQRTHLTSTSASSRELSSQPGLPTEDGGGISIHYLRIGYAKA